MKISICFESLIEKALNLIGIDSRDDYIADISVNIEESNYNAETFESDFAGEITLYQIINEKHELIGFFEFVIRFSEINLNKSIVLQNTTPIGENKIEGTTVKYSEEF